jgi:Helix-turn-helix.
MSSEDTGIVYVYGHKTAYFLRRENKITALAYYRKKLNKTQDECADAIGVTLRQYQRYESTDSHLGDAKYSVVEKLANFLQVEPNMLVKNGLIILNSNE